MGKKTKVFGGLLLAGILLALTLQNSPTLNSTLLFLTVGFIFGRTIRYALTEEKKRVNNEKENDE